MNTVAQLKVGQRAKVTAIDGQDEISMRLLEMGLTPGAECALVGTALLGDPVEIELRGYRLSLRKSEAMRVRIEMI